MNFDFSEQQKLIQSQAKRFLKEQCNNQKVRAVMDDDSQHMDFDLWSKIIELGWLGMSIPESYGGSGLGYLEQCVLAQELGRSLAPTPYSSTVYLLTETLKLAASDAQKKNLFPKIAAGKVVGTLAISEGIGQTLSSNPNCKVVLGADGKSALLSGEKIAVVDGMIADLAVVSAIDERGQIGLYLLELAQPSVTRSSLNSIDPSRPQAKLEFKQASADLLGDSNQGKELLRQLADRAAVLFAFEQVGGCEAALEMGIAYTKQRFAFGRSVASFQAIKHKFADMFVAKEIALANAYYAAWALNTGAPELPLAAATARVSALDAYFLCAKENLQAHGGMGYTWEFDCHLHYRRAQHLSLNIGSSHFWKEQLTAELLSSELFPVKV